jgi:hypothetical protein
MVGVVAMAGCGGGSSPSSPTQQPFSQTVAGSVGVFGTVAHSIGPVPRGGAMSVTVTWTGGADLDLYLTNPVAPSSRSSPRVSCTAAFRWICESGARAADGDQGGEVPLVRRQRQHRAVRQPHDHHSYRVSR